MLEWVDQFQIRPLATGYMRFLSLICAHRVACTMTDVQLDQIDIDPSFDDFLVHLGNAPGDYPIIPGQFAPPVTSPSTDSDISSCMSEAAAGNLVGVLDRDLTRQEQVILINVLLSYLVGYAPLEWHVIHISNAKQTAFRALLRAACARGYAGPSMASIDMYMLRLLRPSVVPPWFHQLLMQQDVSVPSFPTSEFIKSVQSFSANFDRRFETPASVMMAVGFWVTYCVIPLKTWMNSHRVPPCLQKSKLDSATGLHRSMWVLSLPSFREYLVIELARITEDHRTVAPVVTSQKRAPATPFPIVVGKKRRKLIKDFV